MIAMSLQSFNGSNMCKATCTTATKHEGYIHGRLLEALEERMESIENVHMPKVNGTDMLYINKV